jgi:hypothetical protein
MVEYYTPMNENGTMRPVETVPEMREGRIKENDGGVNSSMVHGKSFCKCHSVPSTTILKKKNNRKKPEVS